ncbi:MAG TPA: RNA polymerase sigma factor [Anaerolineales bacterium]|nr:RNA polymerase sigma factor [Anaerolineales bacterium]
MDEKQAIQRLKNGDIGGLEYLVTNYQLKAIRAAFLITRDPGLAEDIVHDAFLHAYYAIERFDATRPFGPWFLRSVVNASVKTMQRAARQVEIDADEIVFADLARRVESVESQIESIEVQDQIWAALQELSPRQRAVIVQRYFLGMSESEMADQSDTATGTIKWLLNAARERLRELLAERSER